MTLSDVKLDSLKGNLDVTITYEPIEQEVTTEQAIHKMAVDVLNGMYGSGTARKDNLYKVIQTEVNRIVEEKTNKGA